MSKRKKEFLAKNGCDKQQDYNKHIRDFLFFSQQVLEQTEALIAEVNVAPLTSDQFLGSPLRPINNHVHYSNGK